MKASRLGLILLILSLIPVASAQPAHIIHDDLSDPKWTNSTFNLIYNQPLSQYYLNGTPTEITDFNDFTENDPNSKLSHTSPRSTFTLLSRDDPNTHLRLSGTYNDFTYYFELYVDSVESSTSTNRIMIFDTTNNVEDYADNLAGGYEQFGIMLRSSSSTTMYRLCLIETYNSAAYFFNAPGNNLDVDTTYYIQITRANQAVTMHVYTDSGYTIEESDYVGGVSGTLQADWSATYLMVPQSVYQSGLIRHTGYVQNMRTSLGGYSEGYLITDDLLVNTTETASTLIYNFTLNGMGFNVSYSQDLSSWTLLTDYTQDLPNNMGVTYFDGLNLTAPLYIKYGFETNGEQTPILYDYHFIYYSGNGAVDGLVFGDINWLFAFIWFALLAIGYSQKNKPMKVIGSLVGIVAGVLYIDSNLILAIIMIFLNLVLFVYEAANKK
jgi:hypothetical protein